MVRRRAIVGLLSLWMGCAAEPPSTAPPARAPLSTEAASTTTTAPGAPLEQPGAWTPLAPGIELGSFVIDPPGEAPPAPVRVARVDPARAELVVLSASNTPERRGKSARAWAKEAGLVAVLNASMFQTDHLTSTHHLASRGHVNNGAAFRERSVIALDPRRGPPHAKFFDASCDALPEAGAQYQTLIEGIRMLSCTGEIVWKRQPKQWSHAVIGLDQEGRVLLIHMRAPMVTRDFVEALRALPLGLRQLQYAEGGPEAQLFVSDGARVGEWVGSFETGFLEDDSNFIAWPVPNVLGARPRPQETP